MDEKRNYHFFISLSKDKKNAATACVTALSIWIATGYFFRYPFSLASLMVAEMPFLLMVLIPWAETLRVT